MDTKRDDQAVSDTGSKYGLRKVPEGALVGCAGGILAKAAGG